MYLLLVVEVGRYTYQIEYFLAPPTLFPTANFSGNHNSKAKTKLDGEQSGMLTLDYYYVYRRRRVRQY